MNITAKFSISEASDRRFIDASLRLARRHQGQTGTNPSVACVIVANDEAGQRIVGAGITAKGGRPHAEPPALLEAGELAKGATAYVTLEPCAHHGKTPPCAQTLIDAGVGRVVTAIVDPDDRVNGKGHQMLQQAGVVVSVMDGGENAARVMQGYLKARTASRPFVTLKMAMTENGMIGSTQEGNLKISGPISIAQTHLQRARHHAILIGSGTAISDDPGLTCRLPGLQHRSPVRVVLDAKAKISESSNLVKTATTVPTIVVAPMDAPAEWQEMLKRNSVQHLACEMDKDHIALPELMDDLGARGIQSVLVEGGARVAASILADNLVDEILIHLGGEAETPRSPDHAVFAPFNPANIPSGFVLSQTLSFGSDTSLRYTRVAS